MVSWFKEEFGKAEEAIAKTRGITAEEIFEEMAKTVPPGSLGLTVQPYWSPGLRFPGLTAKGSMIGFGSAHRKEHIYRAILEGLAYALRHGKELLEKKSSQKIDEVIVTGGGSKSDLMMQISADVLGIDTIRPKHSETSGLGSAILTAVGTGIWDSYDVALEKMTERGERFEPIADNVILYEQLYSDVYRRIYPQLGRIFNSIKRITNYPA